MKKLAILTLLLFLTACQRAQGPVQKVTWYDSQNKVIEIEDKLSYGVGWKALIDGGKIFFLSSVGESLDYRMFCLDIENNKGRVFDSISKELDILSTLCLLPGPNGRLAWTYYTGEEEVVTAILSADGWVVEPTLMIDKATEDSVPDDVWLHLLGSTWQGDTFVALVCQGRFGKPEDSKLFHISLNIDGSKEIEGIPWQSIYPADWERDPLALLHSIYQDGAWSHLLYRRVDDGIELGELNSKKEWKSLKKVGKDDPSGLYSALQSPDSIDWSADGHVGFNAYGHKNSPRFVWHKPHNLKALELEIPDNTHAWNGLYRTENGGLRFVKQIMEGYSTFQELGEGRFVNLSGKDGKTLWRELGKPERVLDEGLSFPNGSSHLIFVELGDELYAVELGGKYMRIPPAFKTP